MSDARSFDWDGLMFLGLHQLKLSPDVFWALTPQELMIISGNTNQAGTVMGRRGFEALLAQYPDTGEPDK